MNDLAIVIVSWNVRDLLAQCLDSLFTSNQDTPDTYSIQVWVVDNDSQDGSSEMVRAKFPEVQLIDSRENLGFAGGNNLAIQRSDSRYVLLLNPDTRVLPGGIANLVRFMDENPQAGAAGSLLLNPDGSLQTSCYPFPTLSREFWRLLHLDRISPFGVYRMAEWTQEKPVATEVIQGASLILRRETLDRVGLLDESYFMYTEEVDLCYRIAQDGWGLWWVPQSRVVHYGGQSTSQVASQMFLHLYQSKHHFFKKHHGSRSAMAYKWLLAITGIPRLVLAPLASFERGEKRAVHLRIAGNYRQLLSKLSSW